MQAADWYKRYLEQARWTESLRHYMLNKIPVRSDWTICELGCGTGAVLDNLGILGKSVFGVDKDLAALSFPSKVDAMHINADALHPPFPDSTFNLVFCHYFLLWVADPIMALLGARRVLKPGGYLAIFAEPDYASRITQPKNLEALAELQNTSLATQGANLQIGRNLGHLLKLTGFSILEFGHIRESDNPKHFLTDSEKAVLDSDWEFLFTRGKTDLSQENVEELLKIRPDRWYVPTYYALAILN